MSVSFQDLEVTSKIGDFTVPFIILHNADGVPQIVRVPDTTIQMWFHDSMYGEEFRKLVSDMGKQYGTLEDLKAQAANSTPTKRAAGLGAGAPGPTPKRLRFTVEPGSCVNHADMTGTEVAGVTQLN